MEQPLNQKPQDNGLDKPYIEVQLRDSRKPLILFQFQVQASQAEFNKEFEDIILDLRLQFDHALTKLFGLQG